MRSKIMKVDVIFRGMDHTTAIEEYILKNIEKFKKYFGKENPEATFVHIVLEGNHNHHMYMVEIRVKTPHFNLIAKRENHEMYSLIDEVVHIMERELKNAKEKITDDIHKSIKLGNDF